MEPERPFIVCKAAKESLSLQYAISCDRRRVSAVLPGDVGFIVHEPLAVVGGGCEARLAVSESRRGRRVSQP